MTLKKFHLSYEETQLPIASIKKLAKANQGLLDCIDHWYADKDRPYEPEGPHIGSLSKHMFMTIVAGPDYMGPTGRDSCPTLVYKPTHKLKKAFKPGWFPKGTLVHKPKPYWHKPGWTYYDKTANEQGVTFTKFKGYWSKPYMSFIDENGCVLYCRSKEGHVQDRALAIFDYDEKFNKNLLEPLRKRRNLCNINV